MKVKINYDKEQLIDNGMTEVELISEVGVGGDVCM